MLWCTADGLQLQAMMGSTSSCGTSSHPGARLTLFSFSFSPFRVHYRSWDGSMHNLRRIGCLYDFDIVCSTEHPLEPAALGVLCDVCDVCVN